MRVGKPDEHGFSLIEIAVVIAIMGIAALLAVPQMIAYKRRQDAREYVQTVADALGNARALAVKEGNPYFVRFDTTNGNLLVVDDDDGDFAIDAGEIQRTITKPVGGHLDISLYNLVASPPAATTVPEDGGGPIPAVGMTFPNDPVASQPGIAFDVRGFPLSMPAVVGGNPGPPGSGIGSYYVTDNNDVVYAVTLSALGATRMRIFRSTIGDWY